MRTTESFQVSAVVLTTSDMGAPITYQKGQTRHFQIISARQGLEAPPQVGLSSAEKTYLVNQLDAADKLAGLSFLCLREGDLQAAQQYMQ